MSSLVIIPPFSDFKARLTEILTATKLHFKLVYLVQKYLFPISTTEKEEKETAEIISLYSAKGYLLLGVLNVAQGSKKEQFDNANTYYQMGLRAFEKSINFLKTLDKHKIELLKLAEGMKNFTEGLIAFSCGERDKAHHLFNVAEKKFKEVKKRFTTISKANIEILELFKSLENQINTAIDKIEEKSKALKKLSQTSITRKNTDHILNRIDKNKDEVEYYQKTFKEAYNKILIANFKIEREYLKRYKLALTSSYKNYTKTLKYTAEIIAKKF